MSDDKVPRLLQVFSEMCGDAVVRDDFFPEVGVGEKVLGIVSESVLLLWATRENVLNKYARVALGGIAEQNKSNRNPNDGVLRAIAATRARDMKTLLRRALLLDLLFWSSVLEEIPETIETDKKIVMRKGGAVASVSRACPREDYDLPEVSSLLERMDF